MHNRSIGILGEKIAKQYLEKLGYKICKLNYRLKYSEVDIVVRKENIVLLVEVKTRLGCNYGAPELLVSKGKMRKIKYCAEYLQRFGEYDNCFMQVGLVAVVLGSVKPIIVREIRFYPEIWL